MKTQIEFAKFIQNELWNNGYKNYLIGGSLINAIRDKGVFTSDDVDFAVILDEYDEIVLNKILNILSKTVPEFSFVTYQGLITINPNHEKANKIDFFIFLRKYLNYYLNNLSWMHEKISSFQTFKIERVILENTEFITMHRPDLFLKTVYGDYQIKSDFYKCSKQGDTSHMRECMFYVSENNYDFVDLQYEILKTFFQVVNVKRNLNQINKNDINIFDDNIKTIDKEKNLFYSDFRNFLIQKNIKLINF